MTTKAFNQSVTDSIKNLVNKAKCNHNSMTHRDHDPLNAWECSDCGYVYSNLTEAARPIPDNFSDWLKSNGDDIGGNEIPDRVAANHERYAQQGEKQSIPF